MLADGENALFVTPGDEAGIAAAIIRLIDNPALGRRIAAAGSALYQRLFTMEAFARSVGSLYAMLAPRGAKPDAPVWPSVQEAQDDRQR